MIILIFSLLGQSYSSGRCRLHTPALRHARAHRAHRVERQNGIGCRTGHAIFVAQVLAVQGGKLVQGGVLAGRERRPVRRCAVGDGQHCAAHINLCCFHLAVARNQLRHQLMQSRIRPSQQSRKHVQFFILVGAAERPCQSNASRRARLAGRAGRNLCPANAAAAWLAR